MAGRGCKELFKAILKAQLQSWIYNSTSLHKKPQEGLLGLEVYWLREQLTERQV